jgi:hypothetical protein
MRSRTLAFGQRPATNVFFQLRSPVAAFGLVAGGSFELLCRFFVDRSDQNL